jgi:hypothetical protein
MLEFLWYWWPIDEAGSRGEPESYLRKPDAGFYILNRSERNILSLHKIIAQSFYGFSCEVIKKSSVS